MSADTRFEPSLFVEITPATLQMYSALLLERLAASELPEMGGILHLRGKWTDPGRASGKYYYGAKIVDDGGAQAKVEVQASLVAGRGIAPGHQVVATGRLVVRASNYGIEIRLSASDIQLAQQEEAAVSEDVSQGRLTIERLRSMPARRIPFPENYPVTVTLIQSTSAAAQVSLDCMAELTKLGEGICVYPVQVNMLDPVAIAQAIRDATGTDIVMLIRGGGDANSFEVFEDARVVYAMATNEAHRVVGLGHTGNSTLLDHLVDWTSNTPAQAGAYVVEQITLRQRIIGDLGRELNQSKERLAILEREKAVAVSQLETANTLLLRERNGSKWVIGLVALLCVLVIWALLH